MKVARLRRMYHYHLGQDCVYKGGFRVFLSQNGYLATCFPPCLTVVPLPAQGMSWEREPVFTPAESIWLLSDGPGQRNRQMGSLVASQIHTGRNESDVNLSPDTSTGSRYLWSLKFSYFHWNI